MGMFAKKCAWCGERLANPSYVERMGKRFCSEEHAQEYLDQTSAMNEDGRSGGCC